MFSRPATHQPGIISLLDQSRAITGPGGHSWKKLWPEALTRSGLCAVS